MASFDERLCLQWNDFKDNVSSAFGDLREDKEFTDVTLACEDGQQVEAHKVVLIASSPFFLNILKRNKHPHPLIYMKGVKSENLVAMVDFFYHGEANVFQENLDSFLAIAEELKLKGLSGQSSDDFMNTQDKSVESAMPQKKEKLNNPNRVPISAYEQPVRNGLLSNELVDDTGSRALAVTGQFPTELLALDEKVKSMMTKSQNMIPNGKRANEAQAMTKAMICKVCQKEGRPCVIRDHIEANHLEGIVIHCNLCDKVLSSRSTLSLHKSRMHKNL